MIKYCLKKWENNKSRLQVAFQTEKGWNSCSYKEIVIAIVENILNIDENANYKDQWDTKNITEIDNGDYQGTLLFLIPKNTYQPAEYEYLITFVNYGSCSGCDTLQHIQNWCVDKPLSKSQIKDFMSLAKDIVMNMKKPYNSGWRNDDDFDEVEYKGKSAKGLFDEFHGVVGDWLKSEEKD